MLILQQFNFLMPPISLLRRVRYAECSHTKFHYALRSYNGHALRVVIMDATVQYSRSFKKGSCMISEWTLVEVDVADVEDDKLGIVVQSRHDDAELVAEVAADLADAPDLEAEVIKLFLICLRRLPEIS